MDAQNMGEDYGISKGKKRPLEAIENSNKIADLVGQTRDSNTCGRRLCRRLILSPQQKENQEAVNNDEVFKRLDRTCTRSGDTQRTSWTVAEDTALVEFISLHKDEQETANVWPAMNSSNKYWTKAAKFIHDSVGSASIRKGWVSKNMNNHPYKNLCSLIH